MRSLVLGVFLCGLAAPAAASEPRLPITETIAYSVAPAAIPAEEGLPGRRGWAMLILGFAAGASAMRAGTRKPPPTLH